MMRPQLRQLARYTESVRTGLTTPVRPFSVSCAVREGESKPSKPSAPREQRKGPQGPPRRPPTQSRGPPSGPPNRRPAKAIDARSFAAPAAGSDQPRIIRSPRSRTVRGGAAQQGGRPGGGFGGKPKPKTAAKNQKGRRERRPRDAKREDVDESLEEAEAAAIEKIEQDQALKERPVPVRYEPKNIDFDTLKATWPSLPSDSNSRSAAVLEKLAGLSGRFANGYIPPHELGRRIWKGENVLFESEAEKIEALEEVKRLSQLRADRISQRKGELVEPREVKFSAINAADSKALMEKFAQGKYPALEIGKDQHAAMGDVVRNLRNNGTYETAGKRPQFMAKVESLLASSRVKRT